MTPSDEIPSSRRGSKRNSNLKLRKTVVPQRSPPLLACQRRLMINVRRTCWTGPTEFLSVYELLFGSEGNEQAQELGLRKIAVWLSRGDCPVEVENTSNLLTILLRDQSSSSASMSSMRELRLSYSMAITRFVNSSIDPLQTNMFARSMSTLAQSLGLPLHFIELRHNATHQDLPSIAILRESTRQALDWLYLNYWYPASYPTAYTPANELSLDLQPLRTLLASYKLLSKSSLRDHSQTSKLWIELKGVYRSIEEWVEFGGASKAAKGKGKGKGKAKEVLPTAMEKELVWETIQEVLMEVGGLVPTARKKRCSTRSPLIPDELAALWTPLLVRFEELKDGFLQELVFAMIDRLASSEEGNTGPLSQKQHHQHQPQQQQPSTTANSTDRSYALTIIAWIVHLLSSSASATSNATSANPTIKSAHGSDAKHDDDDDDDEDESITEQVIKLCLMRSTPNTLLLLDTLAQADPALAESVKPLLHVLRNASSGLDVPISTEAVLSGLETMEARMMQLDAMFSTSSAPPAVLRSPLTAASLPTPATSSTSPDLVESETTAPGKRKAVDLLPSGTGMRSGSGWRLLGEGKKWKPTPIGTIYCSGAPVIASSNERGKGGVVIGIPAMDMLDLVRAG